MSALLLGQAWSSRQNSLKNNGRWISGKLAVEKELMKAEEFFREFQALSRYRLNLGAWHGFQEVLLREPVRPEKIEFRFFLPRHTYFYVVFDKGPEGFSGIRISDHILFPNVHFAAEDSGRFTARTPFDIAGLKPGAWNRCSVAFSSGSVALSVNGREAAIFPHFPRPGGRVGFRGCHGPVLIDDVLVRGPAPSPPLMESFFNGRAFFRAVLAALGALLLLNAALAGAFSLRRKGAPGPASALASFNAAVLTAAVVLFGFNLYLLDRYPSQERLNRRLNKKYPNMLEHRVQQTVTSVRERLMDDGPAARRVLVIGTSQTWGMGAATEAQTMVARLEALLNGDRPGEFRYECVNGAVPSVLSGHLLQVYREALGFLRPDVLIAVLSFNDQGNPEAFRESLQELADLCRKESIKLVFVMEAISPEYPEAPLSAAHAVMRDAAEKNRVPLLDAPRFLGERIGDGILWWDIVHLTSFGQDLLARYIHGEIKSLLDR